MGAGRRPADLARGCAASAPPCSPRCRPWPSGPAPSTWARASRTATARPRWPRRPSRPSGPGATSTRPGPGILELRQAIARHQQRFYGLEFDPDDEVLVTAGATEAITAAVLALCEAGDEVVVFEPFYDSYGAAIALAGARRRVVPLEPPDWTFDPDRLAAAITPAHPPDPAQHARTTRPARSSAGRARDHRRDLPSARPAGGDRRGVRAPDLRGHPRAALQPAGHGRADPDGLERREDLLVHRLEGGLGLRAGAAGGRGADRQAVPHLRQRGPVPARGGRRPRPARRVLHRRGRGPAARDATGCAPAWPRPASRSSGRMPPTSRSSAWRGWAPPTGWPSAGTCPHRCGVVAVPAAAFYDDPRGPRPLVRFAFCKQPAVLDEAVRRLARLGQE